MAAEKVVPPTPYTVGSPPILEGGDGAFTRRELTKLKTTLDSILLLMPQGANAAPRKLVDSMVRFSRQPWWPVAGQVADAWVFWDAVAGAWKYVRLN
jgi:hypothetical protein